jgi:AraC-like DNA-binding protein
MDELRTTRPARGGLSPAAERAVKIRLSAGLPIETLARECGLSRRHLFRGFKATTGDSPHRWLVRQRIECAKQMLLLPGIGISEVAQHCGFADQSHLNRMFRRFTGMTPGAWQRYSAASRLVNGSIAGVSAAAAVPVTAPATSPSSEPPSKPSSFISPSITGACAR